MKQAGRFYPGFGVQMRGCAQSVKQAGRFYPGFGVQMRGCAQSVRQVGRFYPGFGVQMSTALLLQKLCLDNQLMGAES